MVIINIKRKQALTQMLTQVILQYKQALILNKLTIAAESLFTCMIILQLIPKVQSTDYFLLLNKKATIVEFIFVLIFIKSRNIFKHYTIDKKKCKN